MNKEIDLNVYTDGDKLHLFSGMIKDVIPCFDGAAVFLNNGVVVAVKETVTQIKEMLK